MSWFPFRFESNTSQRPSGETANASITWEPLVTGQASRSDTDRPGWSATAKTFDVSLYSPYTTRRPSAERLMVCGWSPVVSRTGPPSGAPDRESRRK